ncbi:hypothetical protein H257_09177 [Aphanomyces astaci]|uniref:Anaphase-promoting complex subunit 4 WD40 domain-containing protein n=1 Tax=Aphanomyces astaci TaxID=112090 RepID=W4GBN8_APHAT|nr:hypothetical protein H257_09177 [Aphanomyces astaci]ETV76701.1 hypothetical protein H257_09177 [Aphanomyces astaci]|eukprot:XP_009833613.1 hypothetical protein H257_09177 [Aphanomyces astaci]
MTNDAWVDVDVMTHRHRNHLSDSYSPLVDCIAIPAQDQLNVFRCRTTAATGEFGELEILAQANRAAIKASDPYLHVSWSRHRHGNRVFLAAATLTDVQVWEWKHQSKALQSLRVLKNVSKRICALHWHPLEATLLVHSSTTLKFVSVTEPDDDDWLELSTPTTTPKQLSCWNPSGTHLAITGGTTVTVLSWIQSTEADSPTRWRTEPAAMPTMEVDNCIVALAFLTDHAVVVTTERPVHVKPPSSPPFLMAIAPARPILAHVADVEPTASHVINLMHVKSSTSTSSTFSLVLPELSSRSIWGDTEHIAPPIPSASAFSSLLDEGGDGSNTTSQPVVACAQAIVISWTRTEPTVLCRSAAVDMPKLAIPDMVATCRTGTTNVVAVAVGSHVSSSAILVGQYKRGGSPQLAWTLDDDKDSGMIVWPTPRQVHGLTMTRSKTHGDDGVVLVHVLDSHKPSGFSFASSSASTISRSLAYHAHVRRIIAPPSSSLLPPSSSLSLVEMVASLRSLIENRFNQVDGKLHALDRRLQRVEAAFAVGVDDSP